MKKFFTFIVALFAAATLMAQGFDHGLYVPANATIEVATEVGTTATVNTTTGDVTINVAGPHTSWGDWGNQVKLHTEVLNLDDTKNYEIGFKAVATTDDCPVSHVKAFDNNMLFDITTETYSTTVTDFRQVVRGNGAGNGVIVWSFTWTPAQTVTISDIYVRESTEQVAEDPKPEAAPATPTAEASDVLAVYSESYAVNPGWGYCEGWGQSTALENLDLAGNHVLYYKNFNYLGWGCSATIDASIYNKLHMDIWAAEAGSVNVHPIYGGAGLSTNDRVSKTVTLAAGWNAVDFTLATDFPGLDFSSIFQFKFADGVNLPQFAIDNVYFYEKTGEAVVYSTCAEIYNAAKDSVLTLKDFTVQYVNGSYIYVKDATGSALLYANNYGLQAGDKVAKGLVGTIDIFNGLYELKPTTAFADLEVTAGPAPAPVKATAAPTVADQNKYVVYNNVHFDGTAAFTAASKTSINGVFGTDTIVFYNTFKIAQTFDPNKTYNVTAANAVYKTNVQVYPLAFEEYTAPVDTFNHGLYNPATAVINDTYFGPGWNLDAGADYSATLVGADIVLHIGAVAPAEMWNAQVFVDPGFAFEVGKMYHYELDVESAGKVCITVKVNDSDADYFFAQSIYDQNIGGGTFHFSTDSVIPNANLNTAHGPLVFGFGWSDANQDVIIKNIRITEVGDAPDPVEKHMYIKHPWGTGADADWTWQEMTECKYTVFDAYEYNGKWGGVGCNIADNAEGNNAAWYATADIQFLSEAGLVVDAPVLATDCRFVYVPSLVGGASSPLKVIYTPTALENVEVVNVEKFMRDGQLIIRRDGVEYTVLGVKF